MTFVEMKFSSRAGCALIKVLKLGDRFRHEIESILVMGRFVWHMLHFENSSNVAKI